MTQTSNLFLLFICNKFCVLVKSYKLIFLIFYFYICKCQGFSWLHNFWSYCQGVSFLCSLGVRHIEINRNTKLSWRNSCNSVCWYYVQQCSSKSTMQSIQSSISQATLQNPQLGGPCCRRGPNILVPAPLSTPDKASIPHTEIWSTRN